MRARGAFITLEGGEGVGKSTQGRRLVARLRAAGHDPLATREPGGSPGAERLRALALDPALPLSPRALALLFYAARADHLDAAIGPALAQGRPVVCDRFHDSTRAYQGAAEPALIDALERAVLGEARPDLTLVLDLDPAAGIARARARGGPDDRFERAGEAERAAVRARFLALAAAEPGRCVVVDAGADEAAVAGAVWAAVAARLPALAGGG